MKNKNSIALLARDFNIQRNISDSPFSGLSWEDTEMLSTAILYDMVISLSKIPETDIFIFVKNSDFQKKHIARLYDNVVIVDASAIDYSELLKYAIDYVSDAGYRRNIITMNYYPLCDKIFFENILLYLSDDQEYLFVAPLKDLTLGMIAFRNIHRKIFNDLVGNQTYKIEDILEMIIKYDIYVITLAAIPSIMNVSDIVDLKNTLERLIRIGNKVPKTTYSILKNFEKKYVIKTNNETWNIRRYF